MIVSPVEILLGTPPQRYPRSEGIHLSGILRARAIEKGILPQQALSDLSLREVGSHADTWWDGLDAASRLRVGIGLAWEEWYIPTLGDVLDHPGEMQVDGIYMTHDGESVDTLLTPHVGMGLFLHEVKATYKSTKTVGNLTDQWLWLEQTKGYCKGLNTRFCYLHVLFICGDYKYPITPQLKCWLIEYTQAEIDTSWEEQLAYVRAHEGVEL